MSLKGLFVYLNTVGKHRRAVRKLCFKCGLYWQGLIHDLSKYSWTELSCGAKYSTGKYSPHVGQRKKWGYSAAWLHHKAHNKHHYQYWIDSQNDNDVPAEMPIKYFIEMVCDRIAACKTYLKEQYTFDAALKYYNDHIPVQIHPKTNRMLQTALTILAQEGEDSLIFVLRQALKKGKEINEITTNYN